MSRNEPPDEPSSPGGWSDLPSDAEDTFFFSPDEVEDYRREKRRRLLDQGREARLRALRDEEPGDEQPAEEQWGGSDEEVRYTSLCAFHAYPSAHPPPA